MLTEWSCSLAEMCDDYVEYLEAVDKYEKPMMEDKTGDGGTANNFYFIFHGCKPGSSIPWGEDVSD